MSSNRVVYCGVRRSCFMSHSRSGPVFPVEAECTVPLPKRPLIASIASMRRARSPLRAGLGRCLEIPAALVHRRWQKIYKDHTSFAKTIARRVHASHAVKPLPAPV